MRSTQKSKVNDLRCRSRTIFGTAFELRPISSQAGHASSLPNGFGSPHAFLGGREHDATRGLGIRSPRRMNGKGSPRAAGSEPKPDPFVADGERRERSSAGRRPFPPGNKGPMRYADRRDVEDRTEMERQTGSPWVISSRSVDQEHPTGVVQRSHGGLEQASLS